MNKKHIFNMEAVQTKLPMSLHTKAMAAQDLPISTYEEEKINSLCNERVVSAFRLKDILRHKSCWAERGWDTLPALQGTIRISRGGKKSTFLHTDRGKKSFLLLHNNINFLLKEKPEAPLDRIWTKK